MDEVGLGWPSMRAELGKGEVEQMRVRLYEKEAGVKS